MAYLREARVLLVFGETRQREVFLEGVVQELADRSVDGSFYLLDVLVDHVFLDEDQVPDLLLFTHQLVVHVHRLRVARLVVVRQYFARRPRDARCCLVFLCWVRYHPHRVFLGSHRLVRLGQVYVCQSR